MSRLSRFGWSGLLLIGAGASWIFFDSQIVSRMIWDYRHPSIETQSFLQVHAADYASWIPTWRLSFFAHAFVGISVLASGILAFLTLLTRQWKRAHHLAGRAYVISVAGIAAPTGLVMSLSASGVAWITRPNFFALSVLWFAVTAIGDAFAKKARYREHGAMMIVSFGLTCSALLQRRLAFWLNGAAYLLDLPIADHAYEISAVTAWTTLLKLSLVLVRRIFGFRARDLIRASRSLVSASLHQQTEKVLPLANPDLLLVHRPIRVLRDIKPLE